MISISMIKLSRRCREVSVVDGGGEDRCGGWKLPVTPQKISIIRTVLLLTMITSNREAEVSTRAILGLVCLQDCLLPPPSAPAQASCLLRGREFMICEVGLVLMMAMTTMMRLREDLNRKKTFSFGHCPNHLTPPP